MNLCEIQYILIILNSVQQNPLYNYLLINFYPKINTQPQKMINHNLTSYLFYIV